MLLAPAAALPAWLLTPPLPVPVVPLLVVPGLEEVEEEPVVPVPPPAVPPAPPAPPPVPCAKAAAPESIKAVAKPIAVSFIGCSCCLLAIGRQTADAALVPSDLRSGSGGVVIDFGFGKIGQQFVGAPFFLENRVQLLLIVAKVELAGQRGGAAIGCDLVMFELLCGGDQPCVAKIVTLQDICHLLRFRDQCLH